jgi:hypothetical protein
MMRRRRRRRIAAAAMIILICFNLLKLAHNNYNTSYVLKLIISRTEQSTKVGIMTNLVMCKVSN